MTLHETLTGIVDLVARPPRPARPATRVDGLIGLRFLDETGAEVGVIDIEIEADGSLTIEIDHGLADVTDDETAEGTHTFMLIREEN